MGSIIGQKIDYNGVGALRGQRHIDPHNQQAQGPITWQTLTQVPPPPRIKHLNRLCNFSLIILNLFLFTKSSNLVL